MGDTQITSGSGGIDPLLTPKSPERLLDLLPQDQLPLWLDGKYELRRRIGVGGMGEIYLAFRKDSEVPYAVKLMRVRFPNAAQMEFFFEEARHLRAATGVGVATVHDWGKAQTSDGPKPYVVLDYYEGAVAPNHPEIVSGCSIEERVRLCAELCGAVARVHEDHAIIHADIKPSNVLVARERDIEGREVRTARLIDFGLARLVREAGGDLSDSKPGGTYRYAAPEILPFGTRSPDERSDQYSLGMTIRAILTGREPEDAEPESPIADRDAGVDRALAGIIARATATDPVRRYPRVRDLQGALVRWRGSRVRRVGSGFRRFARRWPVVAALLVSIPMAALVYQTLSWLAFDATPLASWVGDRVFPLPPALDRIDQLRAVVLVDDGELREACARAEVPITGPEDDPTRYRAVIGRAMGLMADSRASVVACDVMFELPSKLPGVDAELTRGFQKLLDAGVPTIAALEIWPLDPLEPAQLLPALATLRPGPSAPDREAVVIPAGTTIDETPLGPVVHLGIQRGEQRVLRSLAAELGLRTRLRGRAFALNLDTTSEKASFTPVIRRLGLPDVLEDWQGLPSSSVQRPARASFGMRDSDMQITLLTRPVADMEKDDGAFAWTVAQLLDSTATQRAAFFEKRGVILGFPGADAVLRTRDGPAAGWECQMSAAERLLQSLEGEQGPPMAATFARWPGRFGWTYGLTAAGALTILAIRGMLFPFVTSRVTTPRLASAILIALAGTGVLAVGFVLLCGSMVRVFSYVLDPTVPAGALLAGALIGAMLPPPRPRPLGIPST